jgi:hypothetical protein
MTQPPSKKLLCLVVDCDEWALGDEPFCQKHKHELAGVVGVVESISREHAEREDCWCSPTLDFVADDGRKVWVHHEPT